MNYFEPILVLLNNYSNSENVLQAGLNHLETFKRQIDFKNKKLYVHENSLHAKGQFCTHPQILVKPEYLFE